MASLMHKAHQDYIESEKRKASGSGPLHQSHQDYIEKKRMKEQEEKTPKWKLRKCKGCGKRRLLTNQGLCYECLYEDINL